MRYKITQYNQIKTNIKQLFIKQTLMSQFRKSPLIKITFISVFPEEI